MGRCNCLLDTYHWRTGMENVIQFDSHKKTQIIEWINDAKRAIMMIDWNIDRRTMGLPDASTKTNAELAELRATHCAYIAELRKELESL
jgi:hypothetical protein